MAQRLITLCDAHIERGDDSHGGLQWEVTITAPGGKPASYVIDLCADDAKPLADLAEFLADVGRKADTQQPRRTAAKSGGPARQTVTASAADAPRPCPVEGCPAVPSTETSLRSHLRQHHDGLTLAEALGEPLPYQCPECERRFSMPQGMGAHRKSVHGVRGASSGG